MIRRKKKRRWISFGLKTLFGLMFVCSLALVPVTCRMQHANRQQAAVARLTPDISDYNLPPDRPENQDRIEILRSMYEVERLMVEIKYTNVVHGPKWLRSVLGDHFFDDVTSVRLGVGSWIELDPMPILDLPTIERLTLSSPDLRDLSPLKSLSQLKYLRIDYTSVSDLSPLVECKRLESLAISSNRITDLSPLAKLPNLKYLHFAEPGISDLSPVGNISSLEEFSIDDRSQLIRYPSRDSLDLSPLHRLSRLKTLRLGSFAEVNNLEISRLKKAIPDCKIYDDRLYKR